MKLNKEQLQTMSDTQVLRKLYELLGFDVHPYEFESVITIRKGVKVTTAELCPEDIIPLAFKHGIGVMPYDIEEGHDDYAEYKDMWFAQKGVFEFEKSCDSTNPLRAIACCLILVLQETL